MLLLLPTVSVEDPGGSALSPFCLTRAVILPLWRKIILRLIWPEVVESPLTRRAVSGFSSSAVAEEALRTWVSVRDGQSEPADPVYAFKSGPPVGGNKLFRQVFLPAGLLGKGDEVSNLVGSSSTEKKVEQAPLLRGNA